MSNDLQELQDSARKVLNGLGVAADSKKSWAQIADLGWLMVCTPENLGGLGLGLQAACALHTELGRALNTAPFMTALIGIDLIGGSDASKRQSILEQPLSGQGHISCSLADSEFILCDNSKSKATISGFGIAFLGADTATHLLARTSTNDCLLLVALHQQGVTLSPRETWDSTRQLFDVELEKIAVDDSLVLARDETASLLSTRLDIARDFALACDSVGGAEALLEITVQYLQTREQFCRPLALFQALKHRCADLKAQTAAASALLQDSLTKVGDLPLAKEALESASQTARRCKQLACANYSWVCEESLQLHGGIGMTEEHDCHLYLKRAMLNAQLGMQTESYEAAIGNSFIQHVLNGESLV